MNRKLNDEELQRELDKFSVCENKQHEAVYRELLTLREKENKRRKASTPICQNTSIPVPEAIDCSALDASSNDREIIESIAECRGWNSYRTVLLSKSPALVHAQNDKQDAERWRFIKQFFVVEDIDGSSNGDAIYVLCIKESAFESSMISFSHNVSIEAAIDAAMIKPRDRLNEK